MASAIKAQIRNSLFHQWTANKTGARLRLVSLSSSPPAQPLQLRFFLHHIRQRLHTDNIQLLLTEVGGVQV